jgi:precorrin-8X/cobalt-precorrin-8 methylmutase
MSIFHPLSPHSFLSTTPVGIVIAGHGSRNAKAVLAFKEQVKLSYLFQQGIVEIGFIEFEIPSIGEAIDCAITRGAEKIFVLPAMLTSAHHVKTDIPNIIRMAQQKHPSVPILYGRHLDLHPKIVERCKNLIQQALSGLGSINASNSNILLIVVGRGSKDESGNQDVILLTNRLRETFGFGSALYCYTSVANPLFKNVLETFAVHQCQAVLILPYLLFEGILMKKVEETMQKFQAENHNIIVKLTQTLGPDILVAEALQDRCDEIVLRANQQNSGYHQED